MKKIRVRFAPSPTGFLHVGNARTALFNWLFARQNEGAFILRIEDTDAARSSREFESRLMEDLLWLGMDWDEGPDIGGPAGPYRQTMRLEIYREYADKLIESEKAYYCFCSPELLEEDKKKALSKGEMPVYSGRCRRLDPGDARRRIGGGEPGVIRLKTPGKGELTVRDLVRGEVFFDLKVTGDPVLLRPTGLPAYNFAVVVDDYLMKITHVIRGEDHLSNTPRQMLTYSALGLPIPKFAHLSMVLGKDSTRLSKRHGATSVDQFEKNGILPGALINYLALLGWAPPQGREILEKKEMVDLFRLKKVSRSAAVFDYDKLHWINRQHMKVLPPGKMAEMAAPFLKIRGWLPEDMDNPLWEWLEEAVSGMIEKVDRFSDLPCHFEQIFQFSAGTMEEEALSVLKTDCGERVIRSFRDNAASRGHLDFQAFGEVIQAVKKETGCKGKDLFQPVRVALTGRLSGLDLDKLIPLVETGSKLNLPHPVKSIVQRISDVIDFLDG